jgi:hypothetical protein
LLSCCLLLVACCLLLVACCLLLVACCLLLVACCLLLRSSYDCLNTSVLLLLSLSFPTCFLSSFSVALISIFSHLLLLFDSVDEESNNKPSHPTKINADLTRLMASTAQL